MYFSLMPADDFDRKFPVQQWWEGHTENDPTSINRSGEFDSSFDITILLQEPYHATYAHTTGTTEVNVTRDICKGYQNGVLNLIWY